MNSGICRRNGICGICPAGCFITATIEDGVLKHVEAQKDHPLGMICRIGSASPAIVHDPDRLLYPLRRRGPKGTYDFERISWDEAFCDIVDRFKQLRRTDGPETVAIYTGRGSFDMALCDVFQPAGVAVSSASSILFPFGSPNTLGVGALCYVSFAMIAPHVTMGEMLVTMETDLEQAELIVLWGANPATDSPPYAHFQIVKAKERGARVIAIDPRRGETAREAEAEWIPLRPGTDGALALAMINVLIDQELYDESFVSQWTIGFDDLAGMVQHYSPEVVAEITGVPAGKIREVARAIAAAGGACPVMYTGLEYSDSGVQAIRAVFTLWGLAGQLDVPGGLLFKMKKNLFPQNRSRLLPNPDVRKALGRDRFPVYSQYRGESHAIALPDAVLKGIPYRIRALTVLGGSIITAWPNPRLWRDTLSALDFMVSINRYHTADSAYADIVLPAATGYEQASYLRIGPMFKIREQLLSCQGESRSDFQILTEFAHRLGYGHLYPRNEEELLRHALEGSGFTLEDVRKAGGEVQVPSTMLQYRKWEKGLLRPDGQPGFDTPSGRFEIASSILAEHGYDPLPVYTEPGEGPLGDLQTAREYPFVFNSGTRTPFDFRSQHHGVKGLSDMNPSPVVWINTRDGQRSSIATGDRVWVETPRGAALFTARLTDDIAPGVVDAAMGGGGPLGSSFWQDCNVNELTDMGRFDPVSGFPVYKALLCRLRKDAAAPVHLHERIPEGETLTGAVGTATAPLVRKVYLDHNATTPLAPEVREVMLPFLEGSYGNASSIHTPGKKAHTALEDARRMVAQALNCTARRITFTGGGTEADNLAVAGVALAAGTSRRHIVMSAVEHPAVSAACRALLDQGFELTIVPVTRDGLVEPDALRRIVGTHTLLVSIMLANNETGVIQPVRELAQVVHRAGAIFHTDAVQALGKIPIDVEELDVDLLSLSAHKIHGPKGVGALYVRKGIQVRPLLWGGGQEQGLRSGTENIPGIVGFGKAVELAMIRLNGGRMEAVAILRDRLEEGICHLVPGARRNGVSEPRLPNTLSVTLPEIRGESLVLVLDRKGIAFSSGSACKAGKPEPSAALLAMGLTAAEAHCTVRFSLGVETTQEEIEYLLVCLAEVLGGGREGIRFAPCR